METTSFYSLVPELIPQLCPMQPGVDPGVDPIVDPSPLLLATCGLLTCSLQNGAPVIGLASKAEFHRNFGICGLFHGAIYVILLCM